MAGIQRKVGDVGLRRTGGLLAIVAPVLLLSACNSNPLEVTRSLCPATAIPQHTGTMTLFSPAESRDADAVVMTASIFDLENHCVEGSPKVTSNLRFTIGAQRPNAAAEQSVNVQYFVAVVKDGKEIISKQVYDTALHFPAGQVRAQSVETVAAAIDRAQAIAAAGPAPGRDRKRRRDDDNVDDTFFDAAPKASAFEVLVGFQLTDAQVHYNMTR